MDKSMILAIETSCDETSIAILKNGKFHKNSIKAPRIEAISSLESIKKERPCGRSLVL